MAVRRRPSEDSPLVNRFDHEPINAHSGALTTVEVNMGSPPRTDRRKKSEQRAHDLEQQLLTFEERFNREMESARRDDLVRKQKLREKQRTVRHQVLTEMHDLSTKKSRCLVDLMMSREDQLRREFAEVLAREREKAKIALETLEADLVRDFEVRYAELQRNGAAPTPLVLRGQERAPEEAPYFGMEVSSDDVECETGVPIVAVSGPAAEGGLRAGDIVHQITIPVQVRSREDFALAMDKICPDERVHFAYLRDGKPETQFIVAGSFAEAAADSPVPPRLITRAGATTTRVGYEASPTMQIQEGQTIIDNQGRKVTFQSPTKYDVFDIDARSPQSPSPAYQRVISTSSTGSDDRSRIPPPAAASHGAVVALGGERRGHTDVEE